MSLLSLLREDLETVLRRDPAVTSRREALLYPHLPALWGYRVAHALHNRSWTFLARLVALSARLASGGADIHPGARLGRRLFIDHPAGVVIGGTAVVGDDVTLFQEVTLGARCNRRDRTVPGRRRHPIVEDGVVIAAKASVLGPVVVGVDAHIGAHALVLDDVAPRARARVSPALVVPGPTDNERRRPPACEIDESPHDAHDQATSFGDDAAAYERSRPKYPDALISMLVGERPRSALDIGTGTGVVARQLLTSVPRVLGIEPDERMASVARSHGVDVEPGYFETWNARGRVFDLVLAAQSWHWVDQATATPKAAGLLRPGGRLAVFWNLPRPSPSMLDTVLPVYRKLAPELAGRSLLLGHDDARVTQTAEHFEAVTELSDVSVTRFPSTVMYQPQEWIDHAWTWSDHRALSAERTDALGRALADSLATLGPVITMAYENVVVTARAHASAEALTDQRRPT